MDNEELETRWQRLAGAPLSEEWFGRVRELYSACSEPQKTMLRERVGYGRPWPLPSEREWFAASWIDRSPWLTDPDKLRSAVADEARRAFAPHGDWRDTLISLCALYHVSILVGVDPDVLFDEAAGRLTGRPADLLRGFARRPPGQKSFRVFDLEAVRQENGRIIIRSTGQCGGAVCSPIR